MPRPNEAGFIGNRRRPPVRPSFRYSVIISIASANYKTLRNIHVILKPAIAAIHDPQSVFDIGYCTVIHCDAG